MSKLVALLDVSEDAVVTMFVRMRLRPDLGVVARFLNAVCA